MKEIEVNLQNGLDSSGNSVLEKLVLYYSHQIELLKGYKRDSKKVQEYTEIMNHWIHKINEFIKLNDSIIKK